MRRYQFQTLPLLLLTLVAASQPSSADAVLARMRQAQAELTSFQARITQVKSYPQLGIDDPAERGFFYLERGRKGEARVRLQIDEPERRVLLLKDGNYLLYQPRIRQAVEGTASGGGKKGVFSGILSGSREALAELETDYEMQGLGRAARETSDSFHLRFTARPGAEVYCQRIELWVDAELWLPVRQTCAEANQSLITYTLTDVERDVALEDGLFELELPDDVQRIRG